jgi:hypothetical protein
MKVLILHDDVRYTFNALWQFYSGRMYTFVVGIICSSFCCLYYTDTTIRLLGYDNKISVVTKQYDDILLRNTQSCFILSCKDFSGIFWEIIAQVRLLLTVTL